MPSSSNSLTVDRSVGICASNGNASARSHFLTALHTFLFFQPSTASSFRTYLRVQASVRARSLYNAVQLLKLMESVLPDDMKGICTPLYYYSDAVNNILCYGKLIVA